MELAGFSVSDATIDAQHKELFDLIENALGDTEEDVADEELERTIRFLGEYVECHLRHEESYMRAHGYPDLDAHIAWHGKFSETYEKINERFKAGHDRKALKDDITHFVRNWWYKHILVEDKKYQHFIDGDAMTHPPDEPEDYHETVHDVC